MVIEFLSFTVDPADVDEWVDADERKWTAFLAAQDGFLGKQVLVERDDQGTVHAVITWRDEAAWHAIPAVQLEAVDASMGRWRREPAARTFDVLRST